jgi:hypothetical protein
MSRIQYAFKVEVVNFLTSTLVTVGVSSVRVRLDSVCMLNAIRKNEVKVLLTRESALFRICRHLLLNCCIAIIRITLLHFYVNRPHDLKWNVFHSEDESESHAMSCVHWTVSLRLTVKTIHSFFKSSSHDDHHEVIWRSRDKTSITDSREQKNLRTKQA